MVAEPRRWMWSNGWRAAGWSALCVEGILAGGDRPCMASFDLNTLLRLMLAKNAVGIAELFIICAAIPAFVVAASPVSFGLDPKQRNAVTIALIVVTLALQLFVNNLLVWVVPLGLVIGLLIRWYEWARQNWLLAALFSAAALGVSQFSGLEYGHAHCGL